jgi:hypothetical protein
MHLVSRSLTNLLQGSLSIVLMVYYGKRLDQKEGLPEGTERLAGVELPLLVSREHWRRPFSKEPLKIPIARSLSPGLSLLIAWTAKFGTVTGMEKGSWKKGTVLGTLTDRLDTCG